MNKTELRQIVKEEIQNVFNENAFTDKVKGAASSVKNKISKWALSLIKKFVDSKIIPVLNKKDISVEDIKPLKNGVIGISNTIKKEKAKLNEFSDPDGLHIATGIILIMWMIPFILILLSVLNEFLSDLKYGKPPKETNDELDKMFNEAMLKLKGAPPEIKNLMDEKLKEIKKQVITDKKRSWDFHIADIFKKAFQDLIKVAELSIDAKATQNDFKDVGGIDSIKDAIAKGNYKKVSDTLHEIYGGKSEIITGNAPKTGKPYSITRIPMVNNGKIRLQYKLVPGTDGGAESMFHYNYAEDSFEDEKPPVFTTSDANTIISDIKKIKPETKITISNFDINK